LSISTIDNGKEVSKLIKMKKCPNCGAEVDASMDNCPECFTFLIDPTKLNNSAAEYLCDYEDSKLSDSDFSRTTNTIDDHYLEESTVKFPTQLDTDSYVSKLDNINKIDEITDFSEVSIGDKQQPLVTPKTHTFTKEEIPDEKIEYKPTKNIIGFSPIFTRGVAKQVDLLLLTHIVLYSITYLLASFSPDYAYSMVALFEPNAKFIYSAIIGSILSAISMSILGTTPAKFLLGIRVIPSQITPPSIWSYFEREIKIMYSAMLFGMFPFNIITLLASSSYVGKYGNTRWDEKLGFHVEMSDLGGFKVILSLFMLIITLAMIDNFNLSGIIYK